MRGGWGFVSIFLSRDESGSWFFARVRSGQTQSCFLLAGSEILLFVSRIGWALFLLSGLVDPCPCKSDWLSPVFVSRIGWALSCFHQEKAHWGKPPYFTHSIPWDTSIHGKVNICPFILCCGSGSGRFILTKDTDSYHIDLLSTVEYPRVYFLGVFPSVFSCQMKESWTLWCKTNLWITWCILYDVHIICWKYYNWRWVYMFARIIMFAPR